MFYNYQYSTLKCYVIIFSRLYSKACKINYCLKLSLIFFYIIKIHELINISKSQRYC